mmetsp:Transcript_4368/g.9256  ORF Transcript_4368/g.9256 Transcript_4368/m.9256 type:complete len:392 (+) Transcript_4368:21-1196(+)
MALKLLCLVSCYGSVMAQSRSWYFPGAETRNYFMVDQIALPTQFTIETWIKPVGPEGYWLSYATSSNDNCMIDYTGRFTQNIWQHVHVTWDGSANMVYVDGVYQGLVSNPIASGCTGISNGVLVIGQEQDSLGGGFVASQAPGMYLDTVAIYDTAWSANEVAAVAGRECIDSGDPGLAGAWYDGPDDHSGNGHTAYISAETSHVGARGCCSGHQGACFHGDGTVLLESGNSKRLLELSLGDVIKTSDGEGRFSFNPVLNLPHNANNSEPAAFLTLTTETGKMVVMTSDHFIPRCGQGEVTASELVVGDCVLTIDGKETLMDISATAKYGVFTAITQDKFIVVDGIVASPYSQIYDPREKYVKYLSELNLATERKLVGAKGKKSRVIKGLRT